MPYNGWKMDEASAGMAASPLAVVRETDNLVINSGRIGAKKAL